MSSYAFMGICSQREAHFSISDFRKLERNGATSYDEYVARSKSSGKCSQARCENGKHPSSLAHSASSSPCNQSIHPSIHLHIHPSTHTMATTVCEDDHKCKNGSLCVEDQVNESSFYCDCDVGENTVFAGLSCEHEGTVFCNMEGLVSRTSFCTNGGTCRVDGDVDGRHKGCVCESGYNGSVSLEEINSLQ
jgi:hypothetical protein